MESDAPTFQFRSRASNPRYSLVLIFDIEGFSHFFSQPDVEHFVPRFLNHTFRFVSTAIDGGKGPAMPVDAKGFTRPPWPTGPVDWPALPSPVHGKFLGDGALFIWEIGKDAKDIRNHHIRDLFYRLSVLRREFPRCVEQWSDDIPLSHVPFNIRFGLAAGTIYRLQHAYSSRIEYMGYAINLASRLQKYCPEIGFISSARIELSAEEVNRFGFIKLVARKLKGFPREVVWVRASSFERLPEERRRELFIDPRTESVPGIAGYALHHG